MLALLCAAAASGFAQEEIEWSRERRLSRSDFKGRAPVSAQNASMSAITIDTSWACERGSLVTSARATFDPSRSWWRNAQGSVWSRASERSTSNQAQIEARRSGVERDMQLLEHEQIHFDIAELVVRKIRERFRAFENACAAPGDTDSIQQMVAQADRELQEEQQRYDRETGHGTDARAQDAWRRRIRARLN